MGSKKSTNYWHIICKWKTLPLILIYEATLSNYSTHKEKDQAPFEKYKRMIILTENSFEVAGSDTVKLSSENWWH